MHERRGRRGRVVPIVASDAAQEPLRRVSSTEYVTEGYVHFVHASQFRRFVMRFAF
jgi:hypothetical protein